MSTIIEIKNISKSYSINRSTERYLALRDVLANIARSPLRFLLGKAQKAISRNSGNRLFWALKGVELKIEQGEIVGVIGPNGAGKSTLLKILNRITDPTSGEIIIRGRISSLLEVGTGFHPELTGRENIFFSGAILGMKRREIIRKFDEIVAFAEMGPFLDTPVKHYSSGMHVRLAFSVAVHMEPDILLIDEVLAVGDANFQKKCLQKIHEVAKRDKRTIIFVSHNLEVVQNLCDRAIYLNRGEVKMSGPSGEVVAQYLSQQSLLEKKALIEFPLVPGPKYQLTKAVVKDASGTQETDMGVGRPFSIEVYYEVAEDKAKFSIMLQCVNEYGNLVFISRDTDKNPLSLAGRKRGRYCSVFAFPASYDLALNGGRYFITVRIEQDPSREAAFSLKLDNSARKFNHAPGVLLVGEPWQILPENPTKDL